MFLLPSRSSEVSLIVNHISKQNYCVAYRLCDDKFDAVRDRYTQTEMKNLSLCFRIPHLPWKSVISHKLVGIRFVKCSPWTSISVEQQKIRLTNVGRCSPRDITAHPMRKIASRSDWAGTAISLIRPENGDEGQVIKTQRISRSQNMFSRWVAWRTPLILRYAGSSSVSTRGITLKTVWQMI